MASNSMGAGLLSLAWLLSIVSSGVIGLRLWIRYRVRRQKVTLDDLCLLVTYGLGITTTVMVTVAVSWGLGRHIATFADTPQHAIYAIKWTFLAEGPAIFSVGISRISYAILLLSITPPSVWRRNLLWTIIVVQFIGDIAAVTVTYAQCRPLDAYWDHRVAGDCWPPTVQQYIGFTQSSIRSAVDVILALYPANLFWNLKMEKKQKLYLSCIMGLGVFASVASIAKTISFQSFTQTQDLTFALSQIAYWWAVEVNLVLVVVSIPVLSPLIRPANGLATHRLDPPEKILINSFHLQKLKKSNKSRKTDGDDLGLIEESCETNTDISFPPLRNYGYTHAS
ncbi:integral membrane protein [Xylaria palmicola]|nr:integral membrane protein [Xylaria palmicola]